MAGVPTDTDGENILKVRMLIEWKKLKPFLEDAAGDTVSCANVQSLVTKLISNPPGWRVNHQMEDLIRFVDKILRTPRGQYVHMFQDDVCARSNDGTPFFSISKDNFIALDEIKTRLQFLGLAIPN